MTNHAEGTFQVQLTPHEPANGDHLDRHAIEKRFHGDLDGVSQGQMLSVTTETQGSAGYVAIEQVTGTLDGRSGAFFLQHSGLMNRGAPQLTITVIPDSGAGELAGLVGTMTLNIVEGQHFYEFDYTVPPAA